MPLWNGPTWDCHRCGWTNAEIRKCCRNCGAEWFHPDPMVNDELVKQVAEERRTDDAVEERCKADGYRLSGPRP